MGDKEVDGSRKGIREGGRGKSDHNVINMCMKLFKSRSIFKKSNE